MKKIKISGKLFEILKVLLNVACMNEIDFVAISLHW